MKTAIYVISLKTSADRREAFERHCAAAGDTPTWQFFDAHTEMSTDLSYNECDALIAKGQALYPRELACYSSHYATWKTFLSQDADQLLVIEDDVVLDWDFIKTISSVGLAGMGVQYLKLFNKNITPFKVLTDRFHGRSVVDCRGFAHGMQAYMLSRHGAERFLSVCRKISRPIDEQMDRSWWHGIPNVAIFPFPAFERHVPSTIGTVRYERHVIPPGLKSLRNWMRFTEKARRVRQRITGYGQMSSIRL